MSRFVALDGLRGIAALLVVFYHALGPTYGIDGFRGGFLAVDFFFVLSGFVVARAYEHRLARGLSFGGFAKIRAKRLYPTIALGVLIGGAVALQQFEPTVALLLTLAGLALVPLMRDGDLGVFPVNGPMWSLFFEVFANAIHGLLLWRLATRVLAVIAGTSFALLCLCDWLFGMPTFGATGSDFWFGFLRIATGYTTGILLFRCTLPTFRVPAWALALSLPLALLAYNLVPGAVVMLAFPLIVIAGINANVDERIAGWLGRLSYPLYAVHYPVVTLVMALPLSPFAKMVAAISGAVVVGQVAAMLLEPRSRPKPSARSKSTSAPLSASGSSR